MNVSVEVLNRMVTAAVKAALVKARHVGIKTATVVEVSADETSMIVALDSPLPDSEPTPGARIVGHGFYVPGDRVTCMAIPPSSLLVLGKTGGGYDPWHYIGEDQNPPFEGSWGVAPGAGDLDTPDFLRPSYRREGRFCVLRGRSQRATGALNPSPQTVLLEGYRPRNRIMHPCAHGDIGAPGFLIINPDGLVETLFVGGNGTAPDGFVSWDGVAFPVD